MRQGGESWELATVDAGGPPDYTVEARLEVPNDAEPGGAVVAVVDHKDVDPSDPLKVPFRVLDGGPR